MLNPDVQALPGSHKDARAVDGQPSARGGDRRIRWRKVSSPDFSNGAVACAREPRDGTEIDAPPGAAVPDRAFLVDQVAAAALIIRREAFEQVQRFDERFYPAWYEDVDFCWKLKRAGWEVYFAPQAKFVHEGGYSAVALGNRAFPYSYYCNQARYAKSGSEP